MIVDAILELHYIDITTASAAPPVVVPVLQQQILGKDNTTIWYTHKSRYNVRIK